MEFKEYMVQLELDISEMEKLSDPPVSVELLRDLLDAGRQSGFAPPNLLRHYGRHGCKGVLHWQFEEMCKRDGPEIYEAAAQGRWSDIPEIEHNRKGLIEEGKLVSLGDRSKR